MTVRHFLGFAAESDARVAQRVGAVCSMGRCCADRSPQNTAATPDDTGAASNRVGVSARLMSLDHSPAGHRGST